MLINYYKILIKKIKIKICFLIFVFDLISYQIIFIIFVLLHIFYYFFFILEKE